MADIPLSKGVPKLTTPSLYLPKSRARLYVPQMRLPGNYYNSNKSINTRKHVKNIGDILLGNPISGTLQLEHSLEDYGLDYLKYVPILNRIAGAGIMLKEQTLDPIKEHKPYELFINTLSSLGESLDIVANPVKSLFPAAGGGDTEDFLKSMGWAEGSYRKTYQFDTGNWIRDVFFEVIADPLTWVSLGSKEVAKVATDGLGSTVKEVITSKKGIEFANSITDDAYKMLGNTIAEEVANPKSKLIENLIDRLNDNKKELIDELKHMSILDPSYAAKKKLIASYADLLDVDANKKLADLIYNIRTAEGFRHFDNIRKGVKLATSLDDAITVTAFGLTPTAGLGKLIITRLAYPKFKALWSSVVLDKQKQIQSGFFNNTPAQFKRTYDSISKQSISLNKKAYDSFKDVLKKYNITNKDLQNIYVSVYKQASPVQRINKTEVDNLFKKELVRRVPDLLNLKRKDLLYSNPYVDKLLQDVVVDIDGLTEALWDVALTTDATEQAMRKALKAEVEEEIRAWFNNTTRGYLKPNLTLEQMDYETTLSFVLENYFNIGGRSYKLSELPEYLKALSKTNEKELRKVVALLEYLGVTSDNYLEISDIINTIIKINKKSSNAIDHLKNPQSVTSKLIKRLKKTLTNAKTGEFTQLVDASDTFKGLAHKFGQAKYDLSYFDSTEFERLKKEFTDTSTTSEDTVKHISKLVNTADNFESLDEIAGIQTKLQEAVSGLDLSSLDDTFSSYAGIEEQSIASNLIKSVTDFEFDINSKNYSKQEVTQFVSNLEELSTAVRKWTAQIKTDNKAVPIKQVELVTKLNDLLNSPHVVAAKNSIIDLLDETNEALYYLLTSKQGMFWSNYVNFQKVYAGWTKEQMAWFNDIVQPNSPIRNHLIEAQDILKKTEHKNLAIYLDNILCSLDCYMQAVQFLNTDLVDFSLNNKIKKYLTGLLFNTYSNQKGYITDIIDSLNLIRSDFMNQFTRDYNFERFVKEIYPDLPAIFAESPEEAYDLFNSMLGTNVLNAIKEYSNKLLEVQGLHPNNPIRFNKNLFTSDLVTDMSKLGLAYQDILAILDDSKANINLLRDTSDFILYTAADAVVPEFDNIKDVLSKLILVDGGISDFEQFFKNYIATLKGDATKGTTGQTLRSIIISAFRETDKMIISLQNVTGKSLKMYTKGEMRKIRNIGSFITKEKFNEFMTKTNEYLNAYDWSTTNGMLAVKKIDLWDANMLGILPKQINLPTDIAVANKNLEYLNFYTRFKNIYNYLGEDRFYNPEVIKTYRSALTDLYKADTLWGPKQAELYFRNASDRKVLTWHILSKQRSFNKTNAKSYAEILNTYGKLDPRTAKYYNIQGYFNSEATSKAEHTIGERITYNENPTAAFLELDDIVSDGMSNEQAYDNMIKSLPLNRIHDIREFVTKDITNYYKDIETMKANETHIINLHNQDVKALENTRPLDVLAGDTTLIKDTVTDPKRLKILKSYYIKESDRVNNPKVTKFMMRERCEAMKRNFLRWDPEQIRSFIDTNTDGVLLVQLDTDLLKRYNLTDLQKAGLIIKRITPDIYGIRRTSNKVLKEIKKHEYIVPNYILQKQQDVVTNVFKSNRNYFYWDGMDLPDELFTGRMLDLDVYDTIKDSKAFKDFFGNFELQKTYQNIDEKGINNFYKKKILRPNLMVIGDAQSYNNILNTASDVFIERGKDVPYATTDLIRSAFTGSLNAIKRVNSEHKYLNIMFNDDYSLKTLSKIFDGRSDKEIKQFFKRGEFTPAIIRSDRKGRPVIYRIYIDNRKQLMKAMDAGVVVLPHEVYRNAVLAINEHKISSDLIRMYKRTIVGTFKSIYLTTPGYLMRNELDSAIYKNASTSGGVFDIYENLKYQIRAAHIWKKYNEMQMEMLDMSGGLTLNKRIIRKYLSECSPEDRELYMLIDTFATSSASGGLSEALEDMLLSYNLAEQGYSGYAWEKWYNESVLHGTLSPVKWVNDINSTIEQTSRLGLFLKLVDEGSDTTKAIRRVVNTHFDYKLKEPGFNLAEDIFWFSTFPINNMFYYLNEGLTKNPSMLRLQMDMLEQSYNSDGYTWEDVKNSDYLTYNATVGNLRFKAFGKDIILKTGSSFSDFLNILINPVGSMKDRLNPFLAVPLGLEKPEELNPLTSNARRLEAIKKGRSYIPSVYSKLYPRRNRVKRHYSRPYRKSSWSPRPGKTYRPSRYVRYHNYWYMTNRYYFGKMRNYDRWITSAKSYEPYWRLNKKTGLYNRH